ncbi:uncharacterized protein LOC128549190 [Mercenaria mercenaria]|uniref:uncharacterized protein LOC128549190 n=1 Tax=Mercenaria mercenaria TaxID=6596 RepID=UPI00234F7250|nr:uncharacterized protein LOC128549190 [Mercenaria mercenaria]
MDKQNGSYPPPQAISADEAAFRLPPPSYEEIMGVYQTSVKTEQQTSDIPPLAYIDIMPRCLKAGNIAGKVAPTFDDYSAIVEAANRWLQDDPGLTVWKCESIVRKLTPAKDGTISYELNEMLRHDATFGFTVYIKGIRLWLTKRSNPGPPQQLGIKTVVPEKVTIEVPVNRYRHGRGRIIIAGEVVQHLHTYTITTFEGFEDTMKRLQGKLAGDPIQGEVLTIETDNVKAYEGMQKDFDPESTCWSENKDKSQRNTQVIRIFYVKGSPKMEEIGYTEIIPDVIEQPDSATKQGKFETFDNVIVSLSQWVSKNQQRTKCKTQRAKRKKQRAKRKKHKEQNARNKEQNTKKQRAKRKKQRENCKKQIAKREKQRAKRKKQISRNKEQQNANSKEQKARNKEQNTRNKEQNARSK